jgi:hypothetical protein
LPVKLPYFTVRVPEFEIAPPYCRQFAPNEGGGS